MNNNSLDTTEIGKRIKELRKARGLDQLQASQIIGVSRSQWSNLENGKRNLNIQQIKTIADYFGVTLSTLGVDTDAIETVEILERARLIFENNDIPFKEKQELQEQIMRMFIKAKDELQKDIWLIFF